MKSGDPDNRDGKVDPKDHNVVRLPREWIGPLEDLVPISTTARGRAEDERARADLASARVASLETADADSSFEADLNPPAASAFWTEHAAALHDAVQAPPPPSSTGVAVTVDAAPVGATAALARSPVTIGRQLTLRHGIAAAAAAGVIGIAAAAVSMNLGPAPVRTRTLTASDREFSAVVEHRAVASQALIGLRPRVQLRHRTVSHRTTRHSRRPRSSAHAGSGSTTYVHNAVEPSTGSQLPAATSSAPPAPAVLTTPAPPETAPVITPPSRSTPPASTASSHPASTAQPAFGEKGTLGPGHSPDS